MDFAALIQQVGLPIVMVLAPLAVAGLKKLWPSIPKPFQPVASTVLGALFELGITALAGVEGNGLGGAAAGLAGVGLREIANQFMKAIKPA